MPSGWWPTDCVLRGGSFMRPGIAEGFANEVVSAKSCCWRNCCCWRSCCCCSCCNCSSCCCCCIKYSTLYYNVPIYPTHLYLRHLSRILRYCPYQSHCRDLSMWREKVVEVVNRLYFHRYLSRIQGGAKHSHQFSLFFLSLSFSSYYHLVSFYAYPLVWVNSNQISNLTIFIDKLVENTPNLKFLSMLKNPACPNFFNGHEQEDYQRYRLFVLYKLPKLKHLDCTETTAKELSEAKRVGQFSKVAKPSAPKSPPITLEPESPPAGALEATAADSVAGPARYGVSRYVYHGRQSEGNRFILNTDL